MAGIYFLGEYFGAALGWGGPVQAVSELPFNLLQNVAGAIVAIPLSLLVRRAYPPLARYTDQSFPKLTPPVSTERLVLTARRLKAK